MKIITDDYNSRCPGTKSCGNPHLITDARNIIIRGETKYLNMDVSRGSPLDPKQFLNISATIISTKSSCPKKSE